MWIRYLHVVASQLSVMCVAVSDDKEKNKAEILLLSIAANIVSRHTSMVGVDKDSKEKVVGDMIQREVPLMTSRRLRGGGPLLFACAAPPMRECKKMVNI